MKASPKATAIVAVIVVAFFGALLIAGGGDDDDTDRAAETTTTQTQTVEAETTDDATADDTDAERASEVEEALRMFDVWDRYHVEGVEVSGGDIVLNTRLYPKAENTDLFTGACTTTFDIVDWASSVRVASSQGTTPATWSEGDLSCDVDDLPDP